MRTAEEIIQEAKRLNTVFFMIDDPNPSRILMDYHKEMLYLCLDVVKFEEELKVKKEEK